LCRAALVIWLLLGCAWAKAQDISGYWQGIEHDTNNLARPFPTSLTIVQTGSTFTGYFYQSAFNMEQFNVLFPIENGQIANYEGSFQIKTPIRQTSAPGGHWCTGTVSFTFLPERNKLVAKTSFVEKDCQPSAIELYQPKLKAKNPFCPTDVKDLLVLGFDIRWYADAQRQTLLYRGLAYQPTLDTTTTFYITQTFDGNESPVVPLVVHVDPMAITSPARVDALCTTGQGALSVKATGKPPLRYRLDENAYQSSPNFELAHPGSYSLTVEDSLGCRITQVVDLRTDCEDQLYLPAAFSPNGDGVNDELVVWFTMDWLVLERFSLFDRWGTLQYVLNQSREIRSGQVLWSAQASGKTLPPGVYAYQLEVTTASGKRLVVARELTVLK